MDAPDVYLRAADQSEIIARNRMMDEHNDELHSCSVGGSQLQFQRICTKQRNIPTAGQARDVIADLNRIVAPRGVQQSYKLRVGGIDQWLYVCGQPHHAVTTDGRLARRRSRALQAWDLVRELGAHDPV
jgi:hypothetical protein